MYIELGVSEGQTVSSCNNLRTHAPSIAQQSNISIAYYMYIPTWKKYDPNQNIELAQISLNGS